MKRKLVQIVSPLSIVAILLTAGGCYGSFQLVQKVHKFNGTLGNKFVNELGFLVMNIIPVYSVAAFIDAVVLNSIEFWTGKNPSTGSNDTIVPLDEKTTLTLRGTDKTIVLTSKTEEGVVQYVFEKGTDGTVMKDLQGKALARCAMTPEGAMKIYDGSGKFIAECSVAQIQSLAQANDSVK